MTTIAGGVAGESRTETGQFAPGVSGNPDGRREAPRDDFGRFQPGRSGNPKGRPKGARNRRTLEMGMRLAEKYEEIARQIGERAIGGDVASARVALDLIETAEEAQLCREIAEEISSKSDLGIVASSITSAAIRGDLRAATAEKLLKVLATAKPLLPNGTGGEGE